MGEQEKGGGAVSCDGKVGAKAVSLEELRKKMADFARERDWEQFHFPRNLLLALVCFSLPFPLQSHFVFVINFFVPFIYPINLGISWPGKTERGNLG